VIKDDAEADPAELGRALSALAPRGATQAVHPHVIPGRRRGHRDRAARRGASAPT